MEKIITDVLMDIDGTITNTKMDINKDSKSCVSILTEMLAEKYNIDKSEALKMIHSKGSPETECLFNFLGELEISKADYWNRLFEEVRKHIEVAPDAFSFIKFLYEKKVKLYSATTNSKMITLLKLSLGNLADINGSRYFYGYFGGDSFNDPEGKFSSGFFKNILKKGNFNVEKTLMVGDDPVWDLEMPLKAGFKNIIIVDRKMRENIELKDWGARVKSLKSVPDLYRFQEFK